MGCTIEMGWDGMGLLSRLQYFIRKEVGEQMIRRRGKKKRVEFVACVSFSLLFIVLNIVNTSDRTGNGLCYVSLARRSLPYVV
jgi:hypothetical protein